MDVISESLLVATEAWYQIILHVPWYHGFVAALVLWASWLCLLNGYTAKGEHEDFFAWYIVAFLLCLLCANALLHLDFWVTGFFRSVAKMQGWYTDRRPLQYELIAGLLILLGLGAKWILPDLSSFYQSAQPVVVGVMVMLLIAMLRTVSVHHVDSVLNFHVLGISIGRLFELMSLISIIAGAWYKLRYR
jgi:uncharacterized membrane protein